MSIRIVLADDHQLIRQGVRALLEREHFHVVGEASNGRDAVDQVSSPCTRTSRSWTSGCRC